MIVTPPPNLLAKYCRPYPLNEYPISFSNNSLLFNAYKDLHFDGIDKDRPDLIPQNIIIGKYINFCNLLQESKLSFDFKKQVASEVGHHLIRAVLAFYIVLQTNSHITIDISSLIYMIFDCSELILFDFSQISKCMFDFLGSNIPNDYSIIPSALNLVNHIFCFANRTISFKSEFLHSIYFLWSTIVNTKIKRGDLSQIEMFFSTLYKSVLPIPKECDLSEAVLDYALHLSKRFDFSIKGKSCNHCVRVFPSPVPTSFSRDSMIEDGHFIEEIIMQSQKELDEFIKKSFREIIPVLSVAQKILENNNMFLSKLNSRINNDNGFFYRFFFTGVMLFFKEVNQISNSQTLSFISSFFDKDLITHEKSSDLANLVNNVLITIAVQSNLFKPVISLLKSNCPSEVLQGADICVACAIRDPTSFAQSEEIGKLISCLADAFLWARQTLMNNPLHEDCHVLMQIRSSIINVFGFLKGKRWGFYEGKEFEKVMYSLLFEPKSREVSLLMAEKWSKPSPSPLFFYSMNDFIKFSLSHIDDPDWKTLLSTLCSFTLAASDNADAFVLSETLFSTIFAEMVSAKLFFESCSLIGICSFQKNFSNSDTISVLVKNLMCQNKYIEHLYYIARKRPWLCTNYLHPAGILDELINRDEVSNNCALLYATIASNAFSDKDAAVLLSFKEKDLDMFDLVLTRTCEHFRSFVPDFFAHFEPWSEPRSIQLNTYSDINVFFRFDPYIYNSQFKFFSLMFSDRTFEYSIKNGFLKIICYQKNEVEAQHFHEPIILPNMWYHMSMKYFQKRFDFSMQGIDYSIILDKGSENLKSEPTIMSIHPGSFDFAHDLISDIPSSCFLKSMANQFQNPPIHFLVSYSYQNPSNEAIIQRIAQRFIPGSDNISLLQELPLSSITFSSIFFNFSFLAKLPYNDLISLMRFYSDQLNQMNWILVSKICPFKECFLLFITLSEFYGRNCVFDSIMYSVLFSYLRYSLDQDSLSIISCHSFNANESYLSFIDKCLNEIPDFADFLSGKSRKSDHPEDPFKILFYGLLSHKDLEIRKSSLYVLQKVFRMSSVVVTVSPFILRKHVIVSSISETTEDLFSLSFSDKTQATLNFIPMICFFLWELPSNIAKEYTTRIRHILINTNASNISRIPNWCFWLLSLATIDESDEWPIIFAKSCYDKDMLKTNLWLTFLFVLAYHFDLNADSFISNVLSHLIRLVRKPEICLVTLYFLSRKSSGAPLHPKDIVNQIISHHQSSSTLLSGEKPEDINPGQFYIRVREFHRLSFDLADMLLSFVKNSQPHIPVVSNAEIASYLISSITDISPIDGSILAEQLIHAQWQNEGEKKNCLLLVSDKFNTHTILSKALNIEGDANEMRANVANRICLMVSEQYFRKRIEHLGTIPFLEFYKFCNRMVIDLSASESPILAKYEQMKAQIAQRMAGLFSK